jgi:chromosome segregation ATPase
LSKDLNGFEKKNCSSGLNPCKPFNFEQLKLTTVMVKKLVFVLAIAAGMMSCGKEAEKLRTQVDSLKTELQTSQKFAETLQEVTVLMDSIDANRSKLKLNMVEGTTYDDYTSRMKDINNYVKDTQNKIEDLEKSLKKSKGNSNALNATIKKLKADLEERNKEIATLNEHVETLKNENQNLITTVGLQEAELADKESQILAKQQELALIEARIQELMISSKVSEADSYFARAQAVEEAANRTKLAPKKKKETLKEAVELYKKALSLGNQQAQAKITELEKKI